MKLKLLAASLLITLSVSSHAEFFTGFKLAERLQGTEADQLLGLGYTMGVYDSVAGVEVCVPANVTPIQIGGMTFKYLQNNPKDLNLPANVTIVKVLKAAWPCKSKGFF
jgi:hypothetical protein